MSRTRSANGDKTRKKIVAYIRKYVDANGYSPTFREIGDAVGLASTSGVSSHLMKLMNDKVLVYNSMMPRTIRLLVETDGNDEES